MSEINIDEVIEDKESWFTVKDFWIGSTHFERPEKTLDSNAINEDTFNTIGHNFKFREATRIISKYKTITDLYNKYDDYGVRKFFLQKNWVPRIPSVLNFTFDFNPFSYVRVIDEMSGFFDQYYPFSNLLVSVPNIRTEKVIRVEMPNGKKKSSRQIIIDLDGYMKFVDFAYGILNTKNSKPVFVPISLRMKQGEINTLIKHYLEKQYYYYWIDFEGRPVNENRLGQLRYIFRIIKDDGYYDKTVAYFTNVKREILPNVNDPTSEASDVLCSLAGANLIGVNREPRRHFESDGTPPPPTPPNYKSRIFDNDTYYYVKTNNPELFHKNKYTPLNALRLNKEFEIQTEYFLNNSSIKNLLSEKDMLTKYHDGTLLKELVSKEPSRKSLSDYFF